MSFKLTVKTSSGLNTQYLRTSIQKNEVGKLIETEVGRDVLRQCLLAEFQNIKRLGETRTQNL